MSISDQDLLREFVQGHSQDAFSSLVRQHLDFVYSSALRQVRSPDLAAEVSQSVFSDLAREARRLKPDTTLTAWLYLVTRRTAIDLIRRESRRQAREHLAAEIAAMNASSSDWSAIEPLLEDAMDSLDESDRTAILLRFFEDKSLREVGDALGTSDDAAQKRVSRAVDKLRDFFGKRGIAVGSAALAGLITVNSVQAAPAGLALTVVSGTGAGILAATAHSVTSATVTKALAMTTLQKAAVATAVVASLGFGVFEAGQASTDRASATTLRHLNETLNAQIEQLRQDAAQDPNRLAALSLPAAPASKASDELLQLRAEVTRLRQQLQSTAESSNSTDPTSEAMNEWLGRVSSLRAWLAQHPEGAIPENQFLTEQNWLDATKSPMTNETDYRQALSRLRGIAEDRLRVKLTDALGQYRKDNNQFPMSLAELSPYFKPPVDSAVLDRWQILPGEAFPSVGVGEWIITQKSAADPEFDRRLVLGADGGYGMCSFTPSSFEILGPAISAYFAAAGKAPSDPADLLPYVTTDAQKAELQKQTPLIRQLNAEDKATLQNHLEQMLRNSNLPSPR